MERALELLRQGDLDALARHLHQQAEYARKKAKDDAEWDRDEYRKDVEAIAKEAFESSDEDEHITNEISGNGWLSSDRGVYAVMEHTEHPDEAMCTAYSTFQDCLYASAEAAMEADVRKCLEDNRDDWQEELDAKDEEDDDAPS
jgi:hypothetical protein